MRRGFIKIDRLIVTVIVMLMVVLSLDTAVAQQAKEVIIGLAHPLSGPGARFGIVLKNGWETAVEEINQEGGIKSLGGAKIKLAFGDVVNKTDLAASETERLIKQYNPAMLTGCMASNLTIVATEIAERHKVPFLVDNAVAPTITKRGFKYTFRSTQVTTAYAKASLDFVIEIAKKTGVAPQKIALVYEDTDYGIPFAQIVKEGAKELGWQIVADERFPSGTVDLTLTVSKLKTANPDIVFCVGYINDIILLGRTIRDQKFYSKAIIHFGGASTMPDFFNALKKAAEYWFSAVIFAVDMKKPHIQQFVKKYQEKYGELPNENAHNGYIAGYVAKEVLELAGSTDHDKIREAFLKVNITKGPAASEGPIRFDSTGELINPTGIITQNLGGKPVTVWPFGIAAGEVIYPIPKLD
jgi:branched-chain amino acid transport system substrate-binding protein